MNIAFLYPHDLVHYTPRGGLNINNEDPDYPIENAQINIAALKAKTTSKSAIKLYVDPSYGTEGSYYDPTITGFMNHNFSGGTYDLYGSYYWDYGSGGLLDPISLQSAIPIRALDTIYISSIIPNLGLRYFMFDLSNATSADDHLEFGRVILSEPLTHCFKAGVESNYMEISTPESYRRERGYEFLNMSNRTPGGIRWNAPLAEKIELFKLDWKAVSGMDIVDKLKELYAAALGDGHPVVFLPHFSGTLPLPVADRECHYVYLEPGFTWEDSWDKKYTENISLILKSAVRGKP
jgi:hypothetical protein